MVLKLSNDTDLLDTMTPEIRRALNSFTTMVKHEYGDDLDELVLFGSQARGEATADSDIDVGVILSLVDDRRAVRDRLAELAYDVLLETREDIQSIAISRDQWKAPDTFMNPSLIRSMKEDGFSICRAMTRDDKGLSWLSGRRPQQRHGIGSGSGTSIFNTFS